jgi:PAS domain S-box-containing protein
MKNVRELLVGDIDRLFDTMSQGVIFQNADGEIISANPAAEGILGLTFDQLKGRTSKDPRWKAIREDGSDFPGHLHPIQVALRTGNEVKNVVHGIYNPEKQCLVWISVNAVPLFRPGEKNPFQAYAIIEDVTERKCAEKIQNLSHDLVLALNSCRDLREGLDKVLKSLLQVGDVDCGGIYLADPADNSLSLAVHSGLSDEFISHVSYFKADTSQVRLATTGQVKYAAYCDLRFENDPIREKEGLHAFALIPVMSQGKLIALLNLASHTHDSIPQATRNMLETIALQIGGSLKRIGSEAALRESQDLFELFMFHSPIYAYIKEITATESRVLQASDSFKTLIGVSGQDIRGKTMRDLFPSDFASKITADDQNVIADKKVLKLDEDFNGRHFATIKFPIMQGGKTFLAGYTIDITDRKQSEESLRKTGILHKLITENVADVIWTYDLKKDRFTYVSDSVERLRGYKPEEVLTQKMEDSLTPESFSRVSELARQGILKRVPGDTNFIFSRNIVDQPRKDGSIVTTEVSSTTVVDNANVPVEIIGISRDISERVKSEAALQKMQKLESLGILAGGIAHDFNNLLGGIFGYIDLAAESTKEQVVSGYLAKVLATIDRARGLTQQLLTFAKGGAPIKKLDRLPQFIRDTAQFALSGSKISCQFRIPDIWMCEFDRNQIGQVIDNIIINAQQAMPDGGTIEVEATNETFDTKAHASLAAGAYVKISIKDHGIGMPHEMLPKIFDPFYTTKSKGHGLGLATCYSIINRHGGCIEVESELGKGSTFHIYLPAAPDAVSKSAIDKIVTHQGIGVILIMDDEEILRGTFDKMLSSLGYTVVSSQNGTEALEIFKREKNSGRVFTALIFDLTIPGANGGKEIIGEIRKIDRDVPVFVASGYADDPVMAHPSDFGFTASISKPFIRNDLIQMLNRHVLPKKQPTPV